MVSVFLIIILFLSKKPVYASGDIGIATGLESAWGTAKTEIRSVFDKVVFPIFGFILAIGFVADLIFIAVKYRRTREIEFITPVLLLLGTILAFSAPLWIWNVIK